MFDLVICNIENYYCSPSGEEEEASDAEEVKDQETQVPQESQGMSQQMEVDDKDAGAVATAASGASATIAEPKAVSEVKKRAAVLDSTSDSGHASDGTDHGHPEGNAGAAGAGAVANKTRQDDAISTRGDGLERVSYKIGDLGHVAPVTSSGANPEVRLLPAYMTEPCTG